MTRRRKWLLGFLIVLIMKFFLFGVPLVVYWHLLFQREAELVTLDPFPEKESAAQAKDKHIGGFRILGESPLSFKDRLLLGASLFVGQLLDPLVVRTGCFNPRDGIRLNDLEVLVCFECWSIQCHQGARTWSSSFLPLAAEPIWAITKKPLVPKS